MTMMMNNIMFKGAAAGLTISISYNLLEVAL